jgi:4-hydroxybenzoate polyprenyltransferase
MRQANWSHRFFSALRVKDWRFSFIPVIFGLLYLFIFLGQVSSDPQLSVISLLLGSLFTSIGFASFGYLLNEWSDIKDDFKAGKHNKLVYLSLVQRISLLFFTLALLGFPWLFLPKNAASLFLILTEICLFVGYSLPPFRFKNWLLIPNVIDALYAYVVPIYLAYHTFSLHYGELLVFKHRLLLFILLFVLGFRNILIHQINDLHFDRRAAKRTLPDVLGLHKSNRLLLSLIVLEAVLLLYFFAEVLNFSNWPFLLLLVICWLWLCRRNQLFKKPIVNQKIVYHPIRHLFDPLYQLLFPLLLIVLLLKTSLFWLPLLVLHLLLFVPLSFVKHIAGKCRLYLSIIINYSIWIFFLFIGIDLKKRNQSALGFLGSIVKKK